VGSAIGMRQLLMCVVRGGRAMLAQVARERERWRRWTGVGLTCGEGPVEGVLCVRNSSPSGSPGPRAGIANQNHRIERCQMMEKKVQNGWG